MKEKVITAVSLITCFVPWSILYLRTFDWALESPAAEISIIGYCLFMIAGGIFAIAAYKRKAARGTLMQLCVAVNGIYAAAGVVLLGWMAYSRFV